MRPIYFVLMAMSIIACVSSGHPVDPAKVATFEQGRTTIYDVQAALGPPNGSSVSPDSSRVLVYTYVHGQARPESFIPFIGPLVGGADATSQTVAFTFGPDGVLRSSSSYQGQSGTGMGLSAH